jgi:hypothetical protein
MGGAIPDNRARAVRDGFSFGEKIVYFGGADPGAGSGVNGSRPAFSSSAFFAPSPS